MADKQISFETAGNHWYWRSRDKQDCQTGTLVTLPDKAKITGVSFKVAGLDYNDPVYGYQYHRGHMRPAIWDYRTGKVLAKGAYTVLPVSPGGQQPWVHFDLPDTWIAEGQTIIVGFWRDSSTSSYATQWDYNTADASGMTTLSNDLFGSSEGPFTFTTTDTYSNRSLNFILSYASGGKVKVFHPTGGGWRTAKDVRVWTGSGWKSAEVRYFDGTTWQESND